MKPNADKLGWHLLESSHIAEGKTFRLRQDQVELPGNDEPFSYEYEERAESVIVVPVTPEYEVALIRQYRYPVDAWCLETPAGGCHDTGDRSLEEVARKELREEIGARVGELEYVGWFYSAPAFADEKCHVYLAWDTVLDRRPETEETEELDVQLLPLGEALAAARDGRMVTGPCALALLRCEPRLIAHAERRG